MTEFYMLTVDGQSHPTKRYPDIELARTEAARLVAKEGAPCYLLKALEVCVPPLPTWKALPLPTDAASLVPE